MYVVNNESPRNPFIKQQASQGARDHPSAVCFEVGEVRNGE